MLISVQDRGIGIRPEDIDPFGGTHAGKVRVVEDTGPTRILLVHWAGCDIHIIAPRGLAVGPGDEVRPRLDPSRAVMWPAGESEDRVHAARRSG